MGKLPSTLPNRFTNPGIQLRSHYYGGESDTIREIPPEFRAALDLTVLEIPLPFDQEIIPLSDTVLASKGEQKTTSEWMRRTTFKPPGQVALDEFFTNKYKQYVDRLRTFKTVGDATASPGPYTDVKTQNLGNLHFIEDVENAQFVFANKMTSIEILDVTPELFKALVPMREIRQTYTGIVSDPQPPLGPGQYRHEQVQDDVFNLTDTLKTRIPLSGYPIIINPAEYKMTPDQQVETVVMTLDLVGDLAPPVITAETVEWETKILGDGTFVSTVGTTPEVFDHKTTSIERTEVLPEVFKAKLPKTIYEYTFASNTIPYPQPPLIAGELFRSETRETELKVRFTQHMRAPASYPSYAYEYKQTREKQVETITHTLDLGLQTLAPTALSVEGSVLDLGDGTSVMTVGTVPFLFTHLTASAEIADLVPEIFKATIPMHESKLDTTATVVNPQILGPGEFYRSETQNDVFNLTRTVRSRVPIGGYPLNVIALRRMGGERFGGEITQLAGQLNNVEPPVDVGFNVVSSEVRNLGNMTWFKQTEQLDTALFWPTIPSFRFDTEMQAYVTEETQTVDPSYAILGGTNFVESLKGIDKWHSRRIRTTVAPTATSKASALISYEWHPYQFPGTFDYAIWYVFAHGTGYRRANAMLTKHKIYTYWLSRVGQPTIGPSGSGADVEVDEIVTDTVNLPIYSANNVTLFERFPNVLHDDITTTQGLQYAATTPSFTQYYSGLISGTQVINIVGGYTPGSGYNIGDNLSISDGAGHSATIRVTRLGQSNSIGAWAQTSAGNFPNPSAPAPDVYGPFAGLGGAGSGAAFTVDAATTNTYTTGTGWIGTEHPVAATIKPTNIPNLWKIQVRALIMR